jgi:hypothetical protein
VQESYATASAASSHSRSSSSDPSPPHSPISLALYATIHCKDTLNAMQSPTDRALDKNQGQGDGHAECDWGAPRFLLGVRARPTSSLQRPHASSRQTCLVQVSTCSWMCSR